MTTALPVSVPGTIVRCDSDRKLYLPYSSFRLMKPKSRSTPAWLSRVTVHWFLAEREEPIVPYLTVIQGYRTLTAAARQRAERVVDEFFREDEYHQLRDYLRQHHQDDVRTSMLMTPVNTIKPDTDTRTGTLRPYGQPAPEQRETVVIHRLAEEPGYSLPFKVWGAYIDANPLRHQPTNVDTVDQVTTISRETVSAAA
jgi:hypothetical protein